MLNGVGGWGESLLKGDGATLAAAEETEAAMTDNSESDPISSLGTDDGQELEVNEHAKDLE